MGLRALKVSTRKGEQTMKKQYGVHYKKADGGSGVFGRFWDYETAEQTRRNMCVVGYKDTYVVERPVGDWKKTGTE